MNKNQIAKKVFSILNVEPNPARNSIFNLFYESVKDEVLRAKFWEFAVCQKKLKTLGKERNKFLYAFPTDCLYVINVDSANFNEEFNDRLKVRVICTPYKVSKLTYIKRLKDQEIQDKRFIKAFYLALAATLAVGICNDSNLSNRLNGEYSSIINSECMNTESSKLKNCPCVTEIQ